MYCWKWRVTRVTRVTSSLEVQQALPLLEELENSCCHVLSRSRHADHPLVNQWTNRIQGLLRMQICLRQSVGCLLGFAGNTSGLLLRILVWMPVTQKISKLSRNVHNMGSRAAQTRMNVESGMPHWLQLQSPFFWNRLYMEEHPVPFLQNPISPLHISEFIPSIRTDILHSDSCSIPCKYPKSIAKEEWAYQTPQWWPMVVGQNYRTSPCLKIIHWWIQWWSIGHGSMQMALARCSLGSTFCSSVSFASTSDVHMVVCNYIMWYLWYICMQTNVKCACIYIYTMTYRVEDMVVSKIMYQVYYITYNIEYRMYTSRVRASQVTEVSRDRRTYKDKGAPIGTAPDCLAGTAVDRVISWKSLSLTFLNFRHLCLMLLLSFDLACSWHLCIFTNLSLACCLLAACLDIFFSLTFLPHILARWCHFLLIRLAACACHLWFLTASFLLTAQEPGTWHTLLFLTNFFPYSFTLLLSLVPYSSRTDPSTPGTTLCQTSPWRSSSTAILRHISTLSSNLSTPLLSPSLISPHPCSLLHIQYSLHL